MSAAQTNNNTCCICLESAQSRGGVPLYSPGCCGKWFHQTCIDLVVKNGDTKCPACRTPFPAAITGPQPAPVVAPQVQQQQIQQQVPPPAPAPARNSFSNIFGFSFGRQNSSNLNNVAPPPPQQQQVQQQQMLFNAPNNWNQRRPSRGEFKEGNLEEDLLDHSSESGTENAKKSSAAAAPPALPTVTASTSPEFDVTTTGENTSFYVRAGLKFEESTAAQDKVPLDLVCILDNSGSMSGTKLASLKEAMNFVVGCLTPQDRLSIVYFNSNAGAVHGLLKMTPENKQKSRDLFGALEATGGTDIYDGMRYGWQVLENRRTFNPTSCVFLLTDGQDRGRLPEKQELARAIKTKGASLFVFGFGSDHDSEHMAAIADAGECTFTYIESDTMVVDAFGGSIGTQHGASLRNIVLSVNAQSDGVRIVEAMTGSFQHTISSDGRSVAVSFANMYEGETRDILLKLSLPAIAAASAEYRVCNAVASYRLQSVEGAAAAAQGTSRMSHCVVRRVPAAELPAGLTRDVNVDVQVNRIKSVQAINSALRSADASNFGVAADTLKAALAEVQASVSFRAAHRISLAIASDLTDALSRVQSRSAYAAGGRAMISETTANNDRQRSCYTKTGRVNAYQSASSSVSQTAAFASKGSKF